MSRTVQLSRSSDQILTTGGGAVLAFVRGGDMPTIVDSPAFSTQDLGNLPLAQLGVSGSADQLVRTSLPGSGGTVLCLIGLGTRDDEDAFRAAAGSAVRQLAGLPAFRLLLRERTPRPEPSPRSRRVRSSVGTALTRHVG